jgi:hypothetical protein
MGDARASSKTILAMSWSAAPNGGIDFARQFGDGFCPAIRAGGRFIGFVLDMVVSGGKRRRCRCGRAE